MAVVPIWQAAADITRQIDDDTSNTSPSHININDETHHDDTPSWSSGGIRRLRKKKKKNSMSRSKSHKSAKRPKAKEKKKNVFGNNNKDTTEEDDNNNTGGTFVGDEKEEEDTGTIVGDDEEEVIITCNGCATCTDDILGATATAANDEGESESYTCLERIQFLMTSKGGSMSENAACTQVGEEFPTICGSCTPCCTQEQRQVCIDLDVEAGSGRVCTSFVCTLVEEGNFNCDTLKKEPLPQYEYTCPTYNPANPDGTCDNGVCVGKCSAEEVDFLCDQDGKDSCVTKACTKGEEDGATVCGNVVNKADGTACQTNDQFNPEGTCFNGVCSENCSEEDVAACDQDGKDSCVTKACTKGEEDGATVCGNVVNKADGTHM